MNLLSTRSWTPDLEILIDSSSTSCSTSLNLERITGNPGNGSLEVEAYSLAGGCVDPWEISSNDSTWPSEVEIYEEQLNIC